uniref:Rho GDP-dissociation inhibitor 2 n=1 Tax=Schistosoma japonicum TaxID=6182 RepID=C1LKV5_SCHJA|nr:Rho GDP-dissociation inhibitor 2 [Schistosoma japonicum]
MAQQSVEGGEWDDDDKNYKPPEKRTLEEIRSLDKEDESLQRYKASLLGPALGTFNIPFPDNPLNVVFEKFCILVEGQPDIEFNLLGDLSTLKSKPVQIVEDSRYQIQVVYYVQRDIVCGLRFIQSTHKGFNRVDKVSVMIGSYGPQPKPYIWKSEPDTAPKGALSRGIYNIKSQFTDDDKKDYVTWEWRINVVKKPSDP